jgi:hypothetical protein
MQQEAMLAAIERRADSGRPSRSQILDALRALDARSAPTSSASESGCVVSR